MDGDSRVKENWEKIGVSQVHEFMENLQNSMHRLPTLAWPPGDGRQHRRVDPCVAAGISGNSEIFGESSSCYLCYCKC